MVPKSASGAERKNEEVSDVFASGEKSESRLPPEAERRETVCSGFGMGWRWGLPAVLACLPSGRSAEGRGEAFFDDKIATALGIIQPALSRLFLRKKGEAGGLASFLLALFPFFANHHQLNNHQKLYCEAQRYGLIPCLLLSALGEEGSVLFPKANTA